MTKLAPLELEVAIKEPSACERHVTVTIARDDIERYFDDAFSEMMPEAQVPGFRTGRAPRKLVEHRFRKEVSDQVKGSLLVDSMNRFRTSTSSRRLASPISTSTPSKCPTKGR